MGMRSGERRGVIDDVSGGLLCEKEWLSLREASKITGKSVHAFRLLINRGRIEKARKQEANGQSYWEIHRDVLTVSGGEEKGASQGAYHTSHAPSQVVSLPVELYTEQQKERDNLMQGLMMYRWKFEEQEKLLRLLPAPPEAVSAILEEKDQVLQRKDHELEEKAAALAQAEKILEAAKETQQQYQEAMEQLKAKLQEEEQAREVYRLQWEAAQAELKKPWWKRMFKKKGA